MENNIKKLLQERNITQKELAIRSNISESAVSKYTSKKRTPNGKNLLIIAEVLKVRPEDILTIEKGELK